MFVSERHACYGPRAQEDSDVEMDGAMYTTLIFGWRTEARTGSRHMTQLKIFRLLFYKLPLMLPRFSGPPSRLWPLAGHERDLPSCERVADLTHEVRGRAAREIVIIDRIGRS